MIETSTFWLRVTACLYAVGLLHSLLTLVKYGRSAFALAMGSFRVGVVIHGVAIIDLAMILGRIPVDDVSQSLSLCAFLIALVYVIVEQRYRLSAISVAIFPVVFAMTLGAAMERMETLPDPRMRNIWLVVHIVLVLAGYAALFFGALAAVAYLFQERRLKNKQSSALLERLPPLATLDSMLSNSFALGFGFLTLGLLFAILWASIYLPTGWLGDPSITISVFTWALLLITMFLRTSAGWRGRKAAVMALAVLSCSALTWVAHAGLGATLPQ
ncbi:MAG: cytochrome c biogenesis protein CcsA [Acidobacteriota bacterium]